MKYRYAFLFYVGAFFARPLLSGVFPLLGRNLNLILCLTVIFTLIYDDTLSGLFFGPLFALFNDILYAEYIGPSALALSTAGILILVIREYVNTENLVNALLSMLLSTWVFSSLYWLIYYLAGSSYSYFYAMRTLPMQLVLNTATGIILYLILIRKVRRRRKDRYFR